MPIQTLTDIFKIAADLKDAPLHFQGDNLDLVVKPLISTTKPMVKFIFKF